MKNTSFLGFLYLVSCGPGAPAGVLTDMIGGLPPFIFLLTDARSPGTLEMPGIAGRKRR